MSPGPLSQPPLELMQFQRTLTAPPGTTARDLLVAADDYVNQPRADPLRVTCGVDMFEVAGWRVTADVHHPAGSPPFPTLVFPHGGAWVLGAPASHRRLAQDLAALGLLTIVVDYRRAPKHRFPAAVLDTGDALRWARSNAAEFGGNPEQLIVGGDSAGANLAAAALAGNTAGHVVAALLMYGIYDVHRALPRLAALIGGPDPESQLYLTAADARGRLDDPGLQPERYCAHFPPSLVLVGEHDPLLAESRSLSARLADADVPHELVVVPDAPHGFMQLPTEPSCAVGLAAVQTFLQGPLAGHVEPIGDSPDASRTRAPADDQQG